jgi:hypothetical protein
MNIYQEFFENIDEEEWEFFAIDCLNFLGYQVLQSPSRGTDGGLDGLVEFNGIKYLVSGKHYIHSNKAVGTSLEYNITDRMHEHDSQGFIGFYSTLPSTSLLNRFRALKQRGFDIKYYDKDKISDMLPSLPSNILQKYGLPNNIQYVMNIHPSQYQPLNCIECTQDILGSDYNIRFSRAQISINTNNELEFLYGCKQCLNQYIYIGSIEIDQALHQDQLIPWNKFIESNLLENEPSSTFFKDKSKFDSRIQQRMFPSNWGKHPLSLINE